MAKFKMEFSTDNAAFDDGNTFNEIAAVLLRVSDFTSTYGIVYNIPHIVRDSNGNQIGTFGLQNDESND